MKLEGLCVVDLSVFLPGPYLTLALADHGAEVIKVEPPGGDPMREVGTFENGESVVFRNLNRGKKSIVLNLKEDKDRSALLTLSERADIFVESFRPGVMERLGAAYEQVKKRNPAIIYCSISAFGQSGPYRDRPAHDLAIESIAGLISVTIGRDGAPTLPGIPVADYLTALQALSGVLMALWRREKTGEGEYIDVAMQGASLSALANIASSAIVGDRQPNPADERTTGGRAFYQVYDTRDDRQLALAGSEPKFVRSLLEALGRLDLFDTCIGPPGPAQAAATAYFRDTFRQKTLAEWTALLEKLDLCFGPVNTLPEALRDANALASGMIISDAQNKRHLAPPIKFQREPAKPDLRAPRLGEHTVEILSSIGVEAR